MIRMKYHQGHKKKVNKEMKERLSHLEIKMKMLKVKISKKEEEEVKEEVEFLEAETKMIEEKTASEIGEVIEVTEETEETIMKIE